MFLGTSQTGRPRGLKIVIIIEIAKESSRFRTAPPAPPAPPHPAQPCSELAFIEEIYGLRAQLRRMLFSPPREASVARDCLEEGGHARLRK